MPQKLWWEFSNFYAKHTATDVNHRIVFVVVRRVECEPPRYRKKVTRQLEDADGNVLATGKTVKELKALAEEKI